MITIALPKGRLGDQVLDLVKSAGLTSLSPADFGRKLFINDGDFRFLMVKPSDLPIYVQRGVADIGIVGYDILHENKSDVYELMNLGIGKCRMCVAAPKDYKADDSRPLRVATTFPNTARKHFRHHSHGVEVIKLSGSVEIAPLLGMSDVIVDIVESGKTLVENNLVVTQEIFDITARLIANKASYQFNNAAICEFMEKLRHTM